MGNCLRRCFGKIDKRKYLRTRYNVERDFSIEFENLMDDETQPEESVIPISNREKDMLSTHKFDALVHEQKCIDAQIDAQLAKQEEELRLEEEAYYEAKREAARVAKLRKAQQNANKSGAQGAISNGPKSWLGDEEGEWDVAGGEDDFEMFLESVKARSLTARIQQQVQFGVADSQSTTSSNQTKERSHTEASSLDLEWEHEAGFVPEENHQERSNTEENLADIVTKGVGLIKDSPSSNDLEWDNNFVSAETLEKEQLLPDYKKKDEDVDR